MLSVELKTLSIIVVSYNTVNLLRSCLSSVLANPHAEWTFELIVVDNASKDGSAEMVRTEFPQVQLIANTENGGFAKANNQALEVAKGRYILLLNPDTEVIEDALWKMLGFLMAEPQAAVAGPRLVYADGSHQHSVFKFPGLWQIFLDFIPLNWRFTESGLNGRYSRKKYEGGMAFKADFPLGACLMLKREVMEQVGKLDEQFWMYMEEIDWCYRIKHTPVLPAYAVSDGGLKTPLSKPKLWQIYCLPTARVIHHAGASSRQFRDEMFYQLYKSRALFYKKHYSRTFQFAAQWLTRFCLFYLTIKARWARIRGKMTREEFKSRHTAYKRVSGIKH